MGLRDPAQDAVGDAALDARLRRRRAARGRLERREGEPAPARPVVAVAGDGDGVDAGHARHAALDAARHPPGHLRPRGAHEPRRAARQRHGEPARPRGGGAARRRAVPGDRGRAAAHAAAAAPGRRRRHRAGDRRHPQAERRVPARDPGQPDGPGARRLRPDADGRQRRGPRERGRRGAAGAPDRPRGRSPDPRRRADPAGAAGAGAGHGRQRRDRLAGRLFAFLLTFAVCCGTALFFRRMQEGWRVALPERPVAS